MSTLVGVVVGQLLLASQAVLQQVLSPEHQLMPPPAALHAASSRTIGSPWTTSTHFVLCAQSLRVDAVEATAGGWQGLALSTSMSTASPRSMAHWLQPGT